MHQNYNSDCATVLDKRLLSQTEYTAVRTMADSAQNLEGPHDLPDDYMGWCQTDSDSRRNRTELTKLHYDHCATSSRSAAPPDMSTVNDGNGDKMAAMLDVEYGEATPTAARRSLSQSSSATVQLVQHLTRHKCHLVI